MKSNGVLLDRDGTINIDYGYVSKVRDFRFIPNAIKAMRLLSVAGYKLIIISNQSGIGRGYYSIQDYNKVTSHMLSRLKEEDICIDKVYFCPHTPEEKCKCRKPQTRLIGEAKKDLNLDMESSFVIGDKTADIKAGENAGCKTILVKTGKGGRDKAYKIKPDYIADDLLDAAEWVVNNKGNKYN